MYENIYTTMWSYSFILRLWVIIIIRNQLQPMNLLQTTTTMSWNNADKFDLNSSILASCCKTLLNKIFIFISHFVCILNFYTKFYEWMKRKLNGDVHIFLFFYYKCLVFIFIVLKCICVQRQNSQNLFVYIINVLEHQAKFRI